MTSLKKLMELTPQKYIGLADELVKNHIIENKTRIKIELKN